MMSLPLLRCRSSRTGRTGLATPVGLAAGALGLIAGCASTPPPAPIQPLFHDALFAAPTEPVDPESVFRITEPMRRYARDELAARNGHRDPRRSLIESLNKTGTLRLNYDAGSTRNAAQAFDARAGNCLSLMIMTAAFARELGLAYGFQQVLTDESYARSGNLILVSGHVNLVLDSLPAGLRGENGALDRLVIDFLPVEEIRAQRSQRIEERTVVAMYMNNRAAETLAAGQLDQSYWWARGALSQDPSYTTAANTLGVVYMHRGAPREAEAALRHVLSTEPDSVSALSNLARLLQDQGRSAEAGPLQARLAQLQPYPPFHFFDLGRQAMARGDYTTAKALFARELLRQPYQDEVHFWAAQADLQLGDAAAAASHLNKAVDYSTTRQTHDLYAAKLDRLRALRLQ